MKRRIEEIEKNIIHVTYEPEGNREFMDGERVVFREGLCPVQTKVVFTPKTVYKYVVNGEPVIGKKMTANGEVTYIENAEMTPDGQSYLVKVTFEIGESEMLLGLGQYEDGIFDYRNRTEYLYESNMRIAIPFLVTTGGYGILIDSESNMIFRSEENHVTFEIDTDNLLSYYVFFGDSIPDIIKGYHSVTGVPSMLPRWAFGYVQSKERYSCSEEIKDTVRTFREMGIPIDCIVQDWYSWEEGLWGEKIFDKKRYPDLKDTVERLHDEHVHFMVSIWPNMSPLSQNYSEFAAAKKLLPNSNLYDAYSEEARALYWEQCKREIMAAGTDALWCDNAEPFSDADWSGEKKKSEEERYHVVTEASKPSISWNRLNTFGLYHAKGIYENWRRDLPTKRVVNLTRSGYSGCQKYGTILWSGDITATWDTLRRQIVEGMKMGLTGMPYWTLDIGGFFVVKDKYENRGCNDTEHKPLWFWNGDYNDGVLDMGYRELYVRWLQFGAFLPIFRSHGTDTPREPWRFGKPGDIFYDTIVKFIRLRYMLMPYIYSLGAKAHFEGEMIMRSLVMDFDYDDVVKNITDEYMFGDAFLVAPVTSPMYFLTGSQPLHNISKTRKVYLPKGYGWYDFFTNVYYEGGTWIDADASLPKIPLFVKAGSIVPVSCGLDLPGSGEQVIQVPFRGSVDRTENDGTSYADENGGSAAYLIVYKGGDGHFTYYNDSGDGYEFEEGKCERITLSHDELTQS